MGFFDDKDDTPKRTGPDMPLPYLTFIGQSKSDKDRARREAFANVLHRWAQHHIATRKHDMTLAEIENYWDEFKHRAVADLQYAFQSAAREDRFWPGIAVLRQHLPHHPDPITPETAEYRPTPAEASRGLRYGRYLQWCWAYQKTHPDYKFNEDDMKLFVEHGHVPPARLRGHEVNE